MIQPITVFKRADVNVKNYNDETSLHVAAHGGSLEICECLFSKYAAKMDKYRKSQLRKLFQYFKTKPLNLLNIQHAIERKNSS